MIEKEGEMDQCLFSRGLIDKLREREVFCREPRAVVCAKEDFHLIINIKPFRMVVELLCLQGNSVHEPPRLVEVCEHELLLDGIARGGKHPA